MIRVKLTLLTLQTSLHTNPSHQDEPFQSTLNSHVTVILTHLDIVLHFDWLWPFCRATGICFWTWVTVPMDFTGRVDLSSGVRSVRTCA